jgi:hypothetical protein
MTREQPRTDMGIDAGRKTNSLGSNPFLEKTALLKRSTWSESTYSARMTEVYYHESQEKQIPILNSRAGIFWAKPKLRNPEQQSSS